MSVEPSWSKIARSFDQTDPRHMDLHARIMSDTVIQSEDIILNLKSLVSVLWRLPPEILIKIFGIDTGVDPVRISQVCARWRYVSLGTPSLWCHIDIGLYGPGRNVDDVARFLERSRDYPLTVKLYCEEEIGDSDSALDLLIQESNRWADVELFIPAALVLSLAPIRGRVSALRRLNINLMACADEDPLLPTLSAFEIAPLLREYKAFHNGLISFFLPWKQLTSYHVWEEDLSALFKCLPRMTNLVVCRIYGPLNDLSYNPQPALTNIHLPHLRTLTIKEGEPTGAIQDSHDYHPWALLELLTLPELRTLKIASCAKARDLMPKLKGLVMRSSCSLETFSLEMYTTRINIKVLSFLKLTPTLLDLRLKCNKMTREFILGLTRGESKYVPCPLPKLIKLRVWEKLTYEKVPPKIYLKKLANMVHTRISLPDPRRESASDAVQLLGEIDFITISRMDEAIRNEFLAMKDADLSVRLEVIPAPTWFFLGDSSDSE